MKSTRTCVNLIDEVKDAFISVYPFCLSRFCTRALYLAVKDKKFFEKVYWTEIKDV